MFVTLKQSDASLNRQIFPIIAEHFSGDWRNALFLSLQEQRDRCAMSPGHEPLLILVLPMDRWEQKALQHWCAQCLGEKRAKEAAHRRRADLMPPVVEDSAYPNTWGQWYADRRNGNSMIV